ncbi:hypothetical protein VP1G_02740 [Cytospora mali]|uniref:F-box domain-containing protein n=1 Tax=Cytospora mali TaxID=578113 RepID=A0A194UUJ4_CYTMA|nr:hypothetical protein VP1G_02740 [Valsa mali var. pyri (nom. inval.)]
MLVESDYSQGVGLSQGHAADMSSRGFTPLSRQNSGLYNREESNTTMAKGLHSTRRPPQRSRTTHEHIPTGPHVLTIMRPQPEHQASASFMPPQAQVATRAVPRDAEVQMSSAPVPGQQHETSDSVAPLESSRPSQPRRPKMGAPRRSYSVMDYEPVPPEQRPASGPLTLSTLPSELHYAIFDFLDPIDATCLGLTNSHFYSIHRRMHGSVPLSVRRDGPNDMEWAWHLAGYPSLASGSSNAAAGTTTNTLGASDKTNLAAWRVRGKGLCRKCGVSRCELHKHIKDWVPENYEYCSVRDRFVHRPGEDAKEHCYMSNPRITTRCGRHRMKKQGKSE